MSRFRSAIRVLLTFVVVSWAVYPALAIIWGYILPPDALMGFFPMGGTLIGGIVGTPLFLSRSGSLRRLGRFIIAMYGVMAVVGLPIDMLYEVVTHYSAIGPRNPLLSVSWMLLLIGVCYGGAYALIYGNGYQRLVHWYRAGEAHS